MRKYECIVFHPPSTIEAGEGGGFETVVIEAEDIMAALISISAPVDTPPHRVLGICETPDERQACFTQLPYEYISE